MPNLKDNSIVVNTLIELGLGENEAILYNILLKTPDATIPFLQHNSPFSRTMLYYVLENLEEFGLITTKKKGKKTVYTAEHPSKLEDFVSDQEKEVNRQKNMLQDVIPDLTSAFRLGHNKPGIRFFEGKTGFKEALNDTLTAAETIRAIVDVDSVTKYVNDINKEYVKKREKMNKPKKLLVLDTPMARSQMKFQDTQHSNTRFLPSEINPFKTSIQIYDNKISYFTLRDNNIISIIITDPDIYQMHKSMFDFLWNMQNKKTITHKGDSQVTVLNN